MFDSEYREVDFATYCPKCNYEKKKGNEEPCSECLEHSMNEHTDRPVKFEEEKKKPKKGGKESY